MLRDQKNIIGETRQYFTSLYTKESVLSTDRQNMFLSKINRVLPEVDKHSLEEPITLKDLWEALAQTEAEKTPGCDDLMSFTKYSGSFWDKTSTRSTFTA